MTNDSTMSKLAARRAIGGLTLIELMVALAIGMFLMIGAITVFMQGRTTFRVTESVSRLQENARFVLDTLEPDIRMAQHWGLTNVSTNILGRAGSTGIPAGIPATCGATWVNDFERSVAATNGSSPWPWGGTCAPCPTCPVGTTAVAAADTLIVRRTSAEPVLAGRTANTLYIQSNRSDKSQLFVGVALPGSPNPATSQPYRVSVNGYYVATDNSSTASSTGDTVPSLRMKTLVDGGTIADREVMPFVEDLQVQFGIDTSPPGTAGRGTIDRFVNPGDAILTNATFIANEGQIIAVRIWVRLRAERPEQGFADPAVYQYAGQNFDPAPPNDQFRRAVVSRTIYLRNANLR
jgi:type IV pilus assembly protein PilW